MNEHKTPFTPHRAEHDWPQLEAKFLKIQQKAQELLDKLADKHYKRKFSQVMAGLESGFSSDLYSEKADVYGVGKGRLQHLAGQFRWSKGLRQKELKVILVMACSAVPL